ncbi:MAG: OmpA family protein [Bacteroidaceae bacterium]|nr:OmpA family protein [Bacteroidaceae bacterium]MBO7588838.1 OmpA family protein [Bacteroidaceae bacterium]MBP5646175.1 OmpA family protein [Bacteroidaceae bacterium]
MKKFHAGRIAALPALLLLLCSCGAELHIRKGDQSFALGEYNDAAAHYKRGYSGLSSKEKELRASTAFKLGESYRRINYTPRALAAYQNAVRYKYSDSTVYRVLADMQLISGKYKDAEKNYRIALEYNPDDVLSLKGLESCSLTTEYTGNPTRFIVRKDPVLNSRYSEWSPVLAGEDWGQIYFTSTRKEASGDDLNPITGVKSCDIFISTKDDKGKWSKPKPIENGPNSEFEDGSCALNPDMSVMYFTYCATDPQMPRAARIMKSNRSDASWSSAAPYSDREDSIYNYAHPAVSPDGKWLYFVSDMDGGYGGLDIWRVPIGGRLIGAENLGPDINTPGNEMFPTFRMNGELYFSSDGHPGMGGLDIFRAVATDDSTWTISNMQSPVNSRYDDFGMTFQGDLTRGYFSSNRNDGRGRDHLWTFELPETVHRITGWVYEKDGYELPDAIVHLVGNDGTNMKLNVKDDGSFTQRVTPGVSYLLLGTSKGYMNYMQEMTADSTDQDREYVLQFPLSSISKPVLIDNIFYDFDKATLRPESAQSLDELVILLNNNPGVTIEIGAHCDYKGDDDYNKRLSQQRAESVVQYLINHGIDKERLTARGYGETQPKTISRKAAGQYDFLNENDILSEDFILKLTEEQQEICNQLNRRTEFRVLRTTYGLFGNRLQ